MTPDLSSTVREHVRAGFPAIWIKTDEPDEAIRELRDLARADEYAFGLWDLEDGLRIGIGEGEGQPLDPLAAVRALSGLPDDRPALMVLHHFHRFIDSPEIVQAVCKATAVGKRLGRHLIVLAPLERLPAELLRLFVVIEHALPTREQLASIARETATEPGELPADEQLEKVLDSAAGLTRAEAENSFALSLIRHRQLIPQVIWELKSAVLRKSGSLRLSRSEADFSMLGGLDSLKSFCRRALAPSPGARPRGVLLLGVPGTGKTAFARALGAECGRPVLELDIGALMGSLVGQTEQRLREALAIVDRMAPAILFVDELEKGMSGVGSSSDGGVSGRLLGTLLTWLNDHESDIFTIGTCNDIRRLPPEFVRAERFDGVFFIDLPSRAEKDSIWAIYRDRFGFDNGESLPNDESWTGAEIRSCCRLARLLQLSLREASGLVIPLATSAAASVAQLRQWAEGRCLDATREGVFHLASSDSARRRKVAPDPSRN